jgi:hypothetical protein
MASDVSWVLWVRRGTKKILTDVGKANASVEKYFIQ